MKQMVTGDGGRIGREHTNGKGKGNNRIGSNGVNASSWSRLTDRHALVFPFSCQKYTPPYSPWPSPPKGARRARIRSPCLSHLFIKPLYFSSRSGKGLFCGLQLLACPGFHPSDRQDPTKSRTHHCAASRFYNRTNNFVLYVCIIGDNSISLNAALTMVPSTPFPHKPQRRPTQVQASA